MLVPIDLRDGKPTGPSLFALSEGRRVAHAAGATVFAIVLTENSLPDDAAPALGRAGADKVLLCEGEGLGAPPLDATHGAALYAAVERVPPVLVLFPAGGAGRELGPGLAARLGAAFTATADLELGEALVPLADGVGRVFLRRWRRDHTCYRRLDPVELERPIVALLPSGERPVDLGTGAVEVEVIACPRPEKRGVREISSEVDDQAEIPLASILVVVDPALGTDALAALVAAAPPDVMVVDSSSAPSAIAASAPRILISVGAQPLAAGGTPRGRVGLVLPPGTPLPPRPGADIVWTVAAGGAGTLFWGELAAALGAFGHPPLARRP